MVIGVVFIASIIIGVGIIFSIKNVNVTLQSYSYSEWDSMPEEDAQKALDEANEIKQLVISKFGGKLIDFVDEKDLTKSFAETDFNGNTYILVSLKKVYPCTLNITVKERREVFVVANGDGKYSTYDSYGTLMRSEVDYYAEGNYLDGGPNVCVAGVNSADDILAVTKAASVFESKFSSLRSTVRLIYLNSASNGLIFKLYCGAEISITGYTSLIETKMQAAYSKFITLSGEEKLSGGVMSIVSGDSGRVSAERYKNGLIGQFEKNISADFPGIEL